MMWYHLTVLLPLIQCVVGKDYGADYNEGFEEGIGYDNATAEGYEDRSDPYAPEFRMAGDVATSIAETNYDLTDPTCWRASKTDPTKWGTQVKAWCERGNVRKNRCQTRIAVRNSRHICLEKS